MSIRGFILFGFAQHFNRKVECLSPNSGRFQPQFFEAVSTSAVLLPLPAPGHEDWISSWSGLF